MDFVGYAEGAARLVNAPFDEPDDLTEFLADRTWLLDRVGPRDLGALRRFTRDLRQVFEASADGDEDEVVARLNALLAKHPIAPEVAGHDAESWHLHVGDSSSSVTGLLSAEALMGVAVVVCDVGALRLGVCRAAGCSDVFVDTSPNRSRRYCSDRCSSRANVAAYRARRRAEPAVDNGAVDRAEREVG